MAKKVYRVWVEIDSGPEDGQFGDDFETVGTCQAGQFATVEKARALQQKLLAAADKEQA